MMKAEKIKIIKVTWLDSKIGGTGWEYTEDIEPSKPVTCFSVGYVHEETEDNLVIVSTMGDEQVVGRIIIPQCSIIYKKYLEE